MVGRITSASFVGRQQELGRLQGALQSAAAGEPATLLVSGEAGIGKTRLVEEFAVWVDDQAQVLLGRCLQLSSGGLPYGPIVDSLRGLTRSLDATELGDFFGPMPDDLTRLLPGLPPRQPSEPVSEFARSRLFELLLRFLDRLAQPRPVLLIMEDIHWADRSTLDLLVFLVRMVRHERLLVVATYRSDELHPQHPLQMTLAELDRSWHLENVNLVRFGREELSLLLGGILGHPPSPAIVQRIFARSNGNAFLAEELLAAEGSQPGKELPRRLQGILLGRVAALAEDTRHVLRLTATVGRPTEHHLLASASDLPEARMLTAIREAVDHQLLIANEDAYGFRHALLQEAVYSELLPGERRRLHAAVARVLTEDAHASALPETAAELSHHWYLAQEYPQTLTTSITAARAAADVYGFTEANQQYERALMLWHQVPDAYTLTGLTLTDLRLQAAEAARWAGFPDRAVTLLQEALSDLSADSEPARAGLVRAQLAECQWETGDGKAALASYEEASRLVATEPASVEKARVMAGHGTELMRQGQYSASRVLCEEAIVVARAVFARAEESRALNTLGCGLSALGESEAGISALRTALAIAEEIGHFDEIFRAYLNLSVVLGDEAGRPHEGLEVLRRGVERMREFGLELALPGNTLRSDLAWWLWFSGHWQEAYELASEVLTRELPARYAFHQQLLLGRFHMGRGRLDLAHEQVQKAARMAEQLIDPDSDSWIHAYLAELATLQGNYSAARAAVAQALQHLAGSEDHRFVIQLCRIGLRAAADAAERAHDGRADAAQVADIHANGEQLLAVARQSLARLGTTFSDATAYAAGCEAEFSRLELRSDPQHWTTVAAAWETLLRPYDGAYARWRQAEAMLATKTPLAATVLREAHHTTVELGEVPLRHEIERLARRARIDLQPPSAKPSTLRSQRVARASGLTPREQEVLRHLVEGRTNRQIARALFISEKTASVHVSNIMAKLGATNRLEAAAIAHRLRLLEPNA